MFLVISIIARLRRVAANCKCKQIKSKIMAPADF